MDFKNIKKTLGVAVLSMVAVSGMAQDLIARQSVSDRRMLNVKNVKIGSSLSSASSANLQNPAAHIYSSFENSGISKVTGHVDANFKIDLRGFHMPTTNRVVTSKYGPRWGRLHAGLDVKVYVGDTIRAAFDGKVRIVKFEANGYGNYVVIRHPNGLETLYGHMSKHLCKENQIVKAGDVIGLGGNTGRSTGSHLHFETRLLGQSIDPATMFDFANQDVTGDFYVSRTGAITKTGAVSRSTSRMQAAAKKEEVKSEPVAVQPVKVVEKAENQKQAADNGNAKAAPQQITYTVKHGDTLYGIAHAHGISLETLRRLNGLNAKSTIHSGMVLKCS